MHLNDVLGDFIPDFRYLVVPLSKYTNQELRTADVLKNHAHKRIIDQAKPLDLIVIRILFSQIILCHPRHTLTLTKFLLCILYRKIVCVSRVILLNIYAFARIFLSLIARKSITHKRPSALVFRHFPLSPKTAHSSS